MATGHTSIRTLRSVIDSDHGAVIQHGSLVFVIDRCLTGGYTAEIYTMLDDPTEHDDEVNDCMLRFFKGCDDDTFPDGGHAVQWCLREVDG